MCCIVTSTETIAGRGAQVRGGTTREGEVVGCAAGLPPLLRFPLTLPFLISPPSVPFPSAPLKLSLTALLPPALSKIFHKSERMFPSAFCAERRKKITVLSLLHAFVQHFAREVSGGVRRIFLSVVSGSADGNAAADRSGVPSPFFICPLRKTGRFTDCQAAALCRGAVIPRPLLSG